ncbi:MAG: glucose-6-phosphate 1-dehydrogenase [Symploca sp. SIO2C1]|nr:glucose-6-phosphate 1-dehydrogenase [Symploca sp. SIO2C1]
MTYNPDKHHRQSIRLKNYDYRQAGAYYVTICCYQKRCLLGEIIDGVMHPNLAANTVQAVWDSLPRHFRFIELDAFVIMPNHIHGIIVIKENDHNIGLKRLNSKKFVTEPSLAKGTQSGSLGAIVQNFKSVTTRRINRLNRNQGTLWHRNYYDEIIRNEEAYLNIRRYIRENALNWDDDEENIRKFQPIN